jgi:hypothetical protein
MLNSSESSQGIGAGSFIVAPNSLTLYPSMHNYFAGTPSKPIALSNEAFALFLNHLGRFLFRKDFDPEVCEHMDARSRGFASETRD